ncbi:cell cycle control protein [Phellopilus nigrolimitatus]|nr:cell cycle control protein [Phellopilus nigrolimitatus]
MHCHRLVTVVTARASAAVSSSHTHTHSLGCIFLSTLAMALFRRRKDPNNGQGEDDSSDQPAKQKGGWRRPANTAFKQQRLKAWQPILTPKTVLPTLLIIGILFGPIGGLLIWGSSLVSEITLDYTDCDTLTPSSADSLNFVDMPTFGYRLRSSDAKLPVNTPQWAFVNNSGAADIAQRSQCFIQFDVPADLDATVLLYYKLTNFFQNHRRYVKSIDTTQLKGQFVSVDTLSSGDCKPLAVRDGKAIWPCGLIANSFFNDTFTNLTAVSSDGSTNSNYTFSEKGIAWPGEAKKYGAPAYDPSDILPPPNWMQRFPDNYTASNLPNLHDDEHFQNWMRTAGLPTFTKLYGRNDQDKLLKGTYQISAFMNFPVKPYKGTKSIVISTVSWMGGKNPFLGWAYVVAAGIFVLLGVLGLIRHLAKPRRLGDMSLLSWSR